MDLNKTRRNNRDFASKDVKFNDACATTNTKPTTRQASKFRRGLGKAYKNRTVNNNLIKGN